MEVEKTTNSEQMFEVKNVEETLFTLVKENDVVRIAIKNNIVTDKTFKTFADAEKYISKKPWELIVMASHFFSMHVNSMQNTKN